MEGKLKTFEQPCQLLCGNWGAHGLERLLRCLYTHCAPPEQPRQLSCSNLTALGWEVTLARWLPPDAVTALVSKTPRSHILACSGAELHAGMQQVGQPYPSRAPLAPGQRNSCTEACRHLARCLPTLDNASAHGELLGRSCWTVLARKATVWGCSSATCCTGCRHGENILESAGTACSCTACMNALSPCSGDRVHRHISRPHQLLDSNMAALELSQA